MPRIVGLEDDVVEGMRDGSPNKRVAVGESRS